MTTSFYFLVFQLFVLIFSVIIHEVAHGAVAFRLGDTTARDAGRLTLNPVKHLDFFGSFLLPVSLYFLSGGSLTLGWAKPVPYNPMRLSNPKVGGGLIAIAGPLSNFCIAIFFGFIIRVFSFSLAATTSVYISELLFLFNVIVFTNVVLGIFNLLPFPPLDGSKVLFAVLPNGFEELQYFLNRYGFFILIFFIFFGFQFITPLIDFVYRLIVGSAGIF